MDDSVSRFWDKYIEKTASCGVPLRARRWYVRHIESFIRCNQNTRLGRLKAADISRYLTDKGRKPGMPDWRFRQIVDALRILYAEIITTEWAASYDWQHWFDDARHLEPDHATIARIPGNGGFIYNKTGVAAECYKRFPELLNRLVAEIRVRQYAVTTEKSYMQWVSRFLLYSKVSDKSEIHSGLIGVYLEYLAVRRNVSESTQKQALNAIVFMFRHVLGIDSDEIISYVHAKKPRRLPVVLTQAEVRSLLESINNPLHHLIASLLYGAGMRLMEAVRLRVCDVDFGYHQIR